MNDNEFEKNLNNENPEQPENMETQEKAEITPQVEINPQAVQSPIEGYDVQNTPYVEQNPQPTYQNPPQMGQPQFGQQQQYQPYQNQPYQPPQNPQPPYQQNQPPQQNTWSFNDYGPMNGTPSKPPKKPKKDKKKGGGLKAFTIVISALFVLSVATMGGYIAWSRQNDGGSSASQKETDKSKPSLDVKDVPEAIEKTDLSGKLSGVEVNNQVSVSVVGIVTYVKASGYQVAGQGSGIIMTKDGYIITNAHVVESDYKQYPVAKIEVVLSDKKTYVAKLLGADTKSDIAVLKVDADNLTPATFGNSDKLQVGEQVYVLGNPKGLKFAGSFTQGVVSAVNRRLQTDAAEEAMEFIQTDAAINPGNSGGALVNQFGQVVGISSAKIIAEDYEGMGFAIPINIAKPVVDSIIANGYVTGRVKIGVTYTAIPETFAQLNGIPSGLRVVSCDPECDVSKKDVQQGDIITKIDGKAVFDQETISVALEDKKPGDEIKLSIYRVDETQRAKTFNVSVTLSEVTPTQEQ